jgi:sortase A
MKALERILFGVAVILLGWCAFRLMESRLYQSFHENEFEGIALRTTPPAAQPALPPRTVPEGTAIGRIDIPRIGVSAVIAEGVGEATLRVAVGRIPETAFPGENGNIGLAGHRDSFFRPLARIRLHDTVLVTAEGGVSTLYRVASIIVVAPGDVSVLEPGPRPSVTLVTCYPFHFLGAAPKRFVVKAERASF